MNDLSNCQNELITNPVLKEKSNDGILDIKYCCDKKHENNKQFLHVFIDEENSTMHKKCIDDGINQLCSDCKYQSSENV